MSTAFSFPKFVEREIPLYTKLNALVDAITAKFEAGVGAAELSWPLTAEGNLDMSIYAITGGRQIWGIVNAGEYDTLDDAIAAAGSGGVVFVPPETTITANGAILAGSGVAVIGAGPSSVLKLTPASTSGWLLATATARQAGVLVANLTLDGNASTGTGQVGLLLRNDADVFVHNVLFKNFSGSALVVTNDGGDGNGCDQVVISNCTFEGGSSSHIDIKDGDQVLISNCTSLVPGARGVNITPSSATASAKVVISNMSVVTPGSSGINAQGPGATFSSSPIYLWLSNVFVDGTGVTSDNFSLGDTASVLHTLHMTNCLGKTATRCGVTVCAGGGSITGCRIQAATTAGIDLTASSGLVVTGNNITGGTIGIDATAAVQCIVTANVIAGTAPVDYGITGNAIYGNVGAFYGGLPGSYDAFYVTATLNVTASAPGSGTVCTFNIPGGVLRQGSVVKVNVYGTVASNDSALGTIDLRINSSTASRLGIPDQLGGSTSFYMNGYCMVTSCANSTAVIFGHSMSTISQQATGTPVVIAANCATLLPVSIFITGGADQDGLNVSVKAVVIEYSHAQKRTAYA